jgi:hypothetical protein
VKEILRITGEAIKWVEISRHAKHHAQHPFGQPSLVKGAGDGEGGSGRLLGGLGDAGAAGGEGSGDLACRSERRKIPGRECRHRSDRLLEHELALARSARRDDPAIGALALLGEPLEGVGREIHLGQRFGKNLSLLEGQDGGDLLGALADQIGGALEDARALDRRHALPALEGRSGSRERIVEIVVRGVRQPGEFDTGRGIVDLARLPASAGAALPGDGQIEIWIGTCVHASSPLGIRLVIGSRPPAPALADRLQGSCASDPGSWADR